MYVDKSVNQIRPYVVCAVLRGVNFDKKRYKSFIDLQDKLHQNVCRRRTYVAIGTHDLDTIQGPFKYKALSPESINFIPLTEDNGKSYNTKELLNFYREDPSAKHLKPYTDIIYDSPVYPVIYDNQDRVLSLPPIINGKHSRIQLHTTNVFIECTGTDITKANIVLDTVVAMFSEYCTEPFTAEAVDVVYEDHTVQTPLLSQRNCEATVDDINGTIGIDISAEEICRLCTRMQLGPAAYIADRHVIQVNVPPTRSDILHAVDVIEDVAIAYGYNNIDLKIPSTLTVGCPLPINQFSDLLRAEVARAGYVEMLTHGLCSTAENFTHLRRTVGPAVSLSNPANIEYEVVRTTLIPGALKTLAYNKSISHKDGVRLFEISDVVVPTNNEVGALNIRKLVALYASYSAGFEFIHGLVDRIFGCAQIQAEGSYASNSLSAEEIADRKRVSRAGLLYFVKPSTDPCFFEGMGADVMLRRITAAGEVESEETIGVFGVVHPEVLNNYEISYPCSIVELNVESLM
jgi:phenylalanyl-tRNA synthetase beta chain